jgi:CRISPR-associated exonuclease Cas4
MSALLLLGAAFLLLLLGIVVLLAGRRMHAASGLPGGEVVYTDTRAWEAQPKPLVSRRYGLIGKPDYLVRTQEKHSELTIPVEVKSGKRPQIPHAGHVLQLAAYCLLVEDTLGSRPPYGLLHYADATLRIPYTDDLRRQVLETAAAIRSARRASDLRRDHDDPARCVRCGYRHACGGDALAR